MAKSKKTIIKIQNEDGCELDELVDDKFWLLLEEKKLIKKAKKLL
jgi:hypothetical protein